MEPNNNYTLFAKVKSLRIKVQNLQLQNYNVQEELEAEKNRHYATRLWLDYEQANNKKLQDNLEDEQSHHKTTTQSLKYLARALSKMDPGPKAIYTDAINPAS